MSPFPSHLPIIWPLILSLLLSRSQLSVSRLLRDSHHTQALKPPTLVSPAANTTRWPFDHLLDAERGAEAAGISELKKYFHRFGYFSPDSNNRTNIVEFSDEFDERFETVVSTYQSRLGLPVTGRLDSATVFQLNSPRCGVSDRTNFSAASNTHAHAHGVSRFTFFPGQPQWMRPRPMTLTYAFSPTHTVDNLSAGEIRAAFERAFSRWARVIPVSFMETMDYTMADVRIGFYSGDHGDGDPFDGVLGILAHAFSPESGRLHLDLSETWAVDFRKEASATAVDLESVATHEIGHVLGLAHSGVRDSVMYPSLSPRTRKVDLRVDDVEGAQALYGSNPNFRFSSLLQSNDILDTSSSPPSLYFGGKGLRTCIGGLVVYLMLLWLV